MCNESVIFQETFIFQVQNTEGGPFTILTSSPTHTLLEQSFLIFTFLISFGKY